MNGVVVICCCFVLLCFEMACCFGARVGVGVGVGQLLSKMVCIECEY